MNRVKRYISRQTRRALSPKALRQSATFTLIGGIHTLGDIVGYYLLTRNVAFFSDHRVIAKGTTFLIMGVSSFFSHRTLTFRVAAPPTVREYSKFLSVNLSALLINAGTTFVLLQVMPHLDILVVIIAAGVSYLWNFSTQKFWVFKNRPSPLP